MRPSWEIGRPAVTVATPRCSPDHPKDAAPDPCSKGRSHGGIVSARTFALRDVAEARIIHLCEARTRVFSDEARRRRRARGSEGELDQPHPSLEIGKSLGLLEAEREANRL